MSIEKGTDNNTQNIGHNTLRTDMENVINQDHVEISIVQKLAQKIQARVNKQKHTKYLGWCQQ